MLILPLPLYTVPLVSRLAMNVLNSVSCTPDRFVLNNDRLQQNDSDVLHLVNEFQGGTVYCCTFHRTASFLATFLLKFAGTGNFSRQDCISGQGSVSQKPRKLFGTEKPVLVRERERGVYG